MNSQTTRSSLIFSVLFMTVFMIKAQSQENKKTMQTVEGTKIESKYVATESANIHYLKAGAGNRTILFIHGWCINGSYWENQLNELASDYQMIAIDLPGFGKSSANRAQWTIEAYASDVIDLINKLALKNVTLVGHSMGGEIILETALQNHPEIIGMIGIDNFKYIGVQFSEEQMAQFADVMQGLSNDFTNTAIGFSEGALFHPSTDPKVKRRVQESIKASDPAVGFSSLDNMYKYAYGEAEKLRSLNLKLILINSDAIPTNTMGLAAVCKSSYELLEINATGHYPMIEKVEDFNVLLRRGLRLVE